jgi:hypothetical protein
MPLHTLLACCTCASAGCARFRLPQLSQPVAWITSSGSFGLSSVIRIRPRCTACTVHRPCTCLLSHAPILMAYRGCGTDRCSCYRRQCRGGDSSHREHGARDTADAGQAGRRPFCDSIISASGGSACACCAGGGWDRQMCAGCVRQHVCPA